MPRVRVRDGRTRPAPASRLVLGMATIVSLIDKRQAICEVRPGKLLKMLSCKGLWLCYDRMLEGVHEVGNDGVAVEVLPDDDGPRVVGAVLPARAHQ